jgi:peptide/nickel transport system substrate-binding protein
MSLKLWIRPDVTCSDGSRLTAAEVADSILRMKDPATKAPNTVSVFGSPTGFDAKASRADNTVTVTLERPYGDLLYGMTKVPVICRAGLRDPSLLARQTLGSGPYVLQDAVAGDRYTYVAHKGYRWGPAAGEARPDKLIFDVIEAETTATNQFLTGGLDLTMAQGPDRARLDRSPQATAKHEAVNQQYTMYLNHRPSRITADVNVRRALVAGLDLADMATTVGGPNAQVPRTIVNPGGLCYQPDAVGSAMIPFDLRAAARYAASAGYQLQGGKLVKDGKQLTIKVLIPNLFGPRVGDFLISEWGKAGVKADVLVEPTAQVVQTVSSEGSDWDVVLTGSGDYSPAWLLPMAGPPPPNGGNISAVRNPAFLRAASAASAKLTQDACADWATAERALYEAADFIPWSTITVGWYGHNVKFTPEGLTSVYPDGLARTR